MVLTVSLSASVCPFHTAFAMGVPSPFMSNSGCPSRWGSSAVFAACPTKYSSLIQDLEVAPGQPTNRRSLTSPRRAEVGDQRFRSPLRIWVAAHQAYPVGHKPVLPERTAYSSCKCPKFATRSRFSPFASKNGPRRALPRSTRAAAIPVADHLAPVLIGLEPKCRCATSS